jgi:hypothetical protein
VAEPGSCFVLDGSFIIYTSFVHYISWCTAPLCGPPACKVNTEKHHLEHITRPAPKQINQLWHSYIIVNLVRSKTSILK